MTSPVTSAEGAITAGTRVDRYRLLGRLGGSGMGVVFRAVDERTGERVALKTLRAWTGDDATHVARFEREARAASELSHPAVVQVLATGTLPDGRPYLVMPLLEGRTLGDAIAEDGPFAPDVAWTRLRPIVEALAEAHARGMVHRDVKPSNVFLVRGDDGEETARLLDFGLARPVDSDEAAEAAKLTQTGELIGTPLYMAPEQCWGLPPGPAVDQYALGVTLFEVLSGRPPFDGPSFAALVQKHLHAAPPPLADRAGAEVEAFVHRLLAKEPGDRFASMEDLLSAGDAAFTRSSGRAMVKAAGVAGARRPVAAYVAWHLGAIAAGLALLWAVGYAGEERHKPYEWFRIGGFSQISTVLWFLLAAAALPLFARRGRGLSGGLAALALLPAISGSAGTYPNWQAIERGLLRVRGVEGFRLFCQGSYEANAARFLGFALASLLFLSLVGWPAGAGTTSSVAGRSVVVARGERRLQLAAFGSLVALSIAAALLGAPSGTLVAATGAACLLASLVVARRSGDLDARTEAARAAMAVLAVGLAFAVGIARVEARQAALWVEPATRAARVLEILDARAEMNATLLLGAAALAGTFAPHAVSLRRALRAGRLPRPSRAAWIAAAVLVVTIGFDVVLRERMLDRREGLRAELAPQFATFVHLDPPPADALDPAAFSPHRSTALQIAKDAVAINGRAVAKLAALDGESGVFLVTAALHQALAQAAVERGEDEVDLAVTADERVPFGRVVQLLRVARAGGARRVDLVFRRGPKPALATGGPPEIAYVVPSDFVAAPAQLADAGFSAAPDEPWSAVAPRLLEQLSGGGALTLAVPPIAP
jgi:serine/threonine-protein kinase